MAGCRGEGGQRRRGKEVRGNRQGRVRKMDLGKGKTQRNRKSKEEQGLNGRVQGWKRRQGKREKGEGRQARKSKEDGWKEGRNGGEKGKT